MNKDKSLGIALIIVTICLLIVSIAYIVEVSNNNGTTQPINVTTISCDTQNITEDITAVVNSINIPSCPAHSCPKYIAPECESITLTDTNMLMLDKFKFRYNMIQDQYEELEDKMDDDNKAYCISNAGRIIADYPLAFSHLTDYYTETGFGNNSMEHLAYDILVTSNDYFTEYLRELEAYCKDTNNKITEGVYYHYRKNHEAYNELTVDSAMPSIARLKEIEE